MRIQFKTSYAHDIRLFEDGFHFSKYAVLIAAMMVLPWFADDYYLGEVTSVLIWSVAGMGVMVLAGHTGLASLGHAAFLAVGAYADVALMERGVPFYIAFPAAGLISGMFGALIAIPAMRMSGIYLAIATLALSIVVEDLVILFEPITGGVIGLSAPAIDLFGLEIDRYGTPISFYYLCFGVTVLVTLGYANLLRTPTGRAFMAIRDSEISARALGVHLAYTKTISFGLSTGVTGLAGALLAHFLGAFNYETFLITTSISLLLMVVTGGLGSIHGAFLGAMVIGLLPQLIAISRDFVNETTGIALGRIPGLDTALFAALLILFIVYEPTGLYGRWVKIRTWLELFPLYRKDMFKRHKSYLKTERMR